MLHQIVTAGGGNDLNVLHVVEHGNLTQRRPIAPQLVGMDHLRHVVFPQEADKKGLGRLGVSVFLKQNVQHVPVFVDRSPQPMLDPADLDAEQTSSRCHREPRRGSRWLSSSVRSGANLMFH